MALLIAWPANGFLGGLVTFPICLRKSGLDGSERNKLGPKSGEAPAERPNDSMAPWPIEIILLGG